jgi:adenosylcobinamide kinase/adenosylcobinamide-phosphate guanylyltransferase
MQVETDYFRNPHVRIVFVTGGARSGRSALAERLAQGAEEHRVWIATAAADAAEQRAPHGAGWSEITAPDDLCAALDKADGAERVIVIDCLAAWLGAQMRAGADGDHAAAALAARLSDLSARAVIVSGEVGLGIVPATPSERAYRDALGRLNQRVAAMADVALLVAAGLPLVLKAPA